jgi:hypothetical protein
VDLTPKEDPLQSIQSMAFFHLLSTIRKADTAEGGRGSPRSSQRRRSTPADRGEKVSDKSPTEKISLLVPVPIDDAFSMDSETVQINIESVKCLEEFASCPEYFWHERAIGIVRNLPLHGGAVRWTSLEKGMAAWAKPFAPYH